MNRHYEAHVRVTHIDGFPVVLPIRADAGQPPCGHGGDPMTDHDDAEPLTEPPTELPPPPPRRDQPSIVIVNTGDGKGSRPPPSAPCCERWRAAGRSPSSSS